MLRFLMISVTLACCARSQPSPQPVRDPDNATEKRQESIQEASNSQRRVPPGLEPQATRLTVEKTGLAEALSSWNQVAHSAFVAGLRPVVVNEQQ